jgi:hypothetical protein
VALAERPEPRFASVGDHSRYIADRVPGARFVELPGADGLPIWESPEEVLDTVELRDDGRIGGVAVHIAARVMAEAKGGEVLVSRTVRDVLLGSRYERDDRGEYSFKSVPDLWRLYATRPSGTSRSSAR